MTRGKYASILFPMIESCLLGEILRALFRNQATSNVEPIISHSGKLRQLLGFLRNEAKVRNHLPRLDLDCLMPGNWEKPTRKAVEIEVTATAIFFLSKLESKRITECIFCEQAHENKEFFQTQETSLLDKERRFAKDKCCFSCFRLGLQSQKL
jgi:hypothetical protein